uniref:Adrenomodulin-like protein n=1 Tax=Ornithodoros parkeri TaxID=140564 RepID=A6N9W5_ORNPR|nr:adrenomodulin-like protein [Ornithodoros parkeri]
MMLAHVVFVSSIIFMQLAGGTTNNIATNKSVAQDGVRLLQTGGCSLSTCVLQKLSDKLNHFTDDSKNKSGGTGPDSYGRRKRRSVQDRKLLLELVAGRVRR